MPSGLHMVIYTKCGYCYYLFNGKSFHAMVHSPNVPNGQDKVRLKGEPKAQSRSPPWVGRKPITQAIITIFQDLH